MLQSCTVESSKGQASLMPSNPRFISPPIYPLIKQSKETGISGKKWIIGINNKCGKLNSVIIVVCFLPGQHILRLFQNL